MEITQTSQSSEGKREIGGCVVRRKAEIGKQIETIRFS